jgi:hypothetical protein
MKTLNLNIERLSTVETVRYSGPKPGGHGVYTINLMDRALPDHQVQIHCTLEALIQLKTRIEASLEHLKTH